MPDRGPRPLSVPLATLQCAAGQTENPLRNSGLVPDPAGPAQAGDPTPSNMDPGSIPSFPAPPFSSRETLKQLDWPWFVDELRSRLRTAPAREHLETLIWVRDADEAQRILAEVEETRALLRKGNAFPLGTPPDIRLHTVRIRKGAILEPSELVEIASWIESVEAMRRFLVIHRQAAPLLCRHAERAPSLSHLIYDIRSAVSPDGEVRDEASPLLSSLRQRARRVHRQIQEKLQGYLHAPEYEDLLQDRFYTLKEDRYVLPVKTHLRNRVDGIVLGSSNSGATLFVEPREIVELNNAHKLVLLEMDDEVRRILREICDTLLAEADELSKGESFLAYLDLIQARAFMAEEMEATVPGLRPEEGLRLLGARHPILVKSKRPVVANDVVVTPPTRTLLITGPNTGGKTCVLKMVGLFALMARAACPLPVRAGSNIPFFEFVFSDIGDDQSLQEDRSSFSGHIQRIVHFLDSSAGPSSLALLDEILIFTDPDEGACLAQAILERIAEEGGITLATTHFLSLKSLAAVDPRFQNASLGFDPHTLEPTYRLSIGHPGGSHALHMAARLGVPEAVLERARRLSASSGARGLEPLLLQVETIRVALEEDRRKCQTLQAETEALKGQLEKSWAELRSREKELRGKYRKKLEAAFQEALRELDSLKKRRREGASGSSPTKAHQEIAEARRRTLSPQGPFKEEPEEEVGSEPVWSDLSCGDPVYLPALRTEARILKMPDRKGYVVVESEGFRMRVSRDQVRAARPSDSPSDSRPRQSRTDRIESRVQIRSRCGAERAPGLDRCDLRGLTAAEALERAGQHLDAAFRENVSRICLIHGLGTGMLRKTVREYLTRCPYPVSFRPGSPQEGGDGVTIVEIHLAGEPQDPVA